LVSIGAGYLLAWEFMLVLVIYLVMMLLYSKWLKHIPILDVLILAAGFVLRVHAGVTLISVERFSGFMVMTLLSLFLSASAG
jgi:4-hydroxybenzoate polyprenyltransferase